MYDFNFGTSDQIEADMHKFMLSIKRMLPRWVNGIPDSEYLAIADILESNFSNKKPVFVETGTGASTILQLNYALKYKGRLFSWDIAGPKGSFLRGVCTEALLNHYRVNIFDYWTFIPYDTLSPYLGIGILPNFVDKVDFCFIDSNHTLDAVIGEIDSMNDLFQDGSVVAIDDANYTHKYLNVSYINIFRKKIGLPPIDSPEDNKCDYFYIEVEKYLRTKWRNVEHIKDTYKENCHKDIFNLYYQADREVQSDLGMLKSEDLEHRFDAWKVSNRII